MSKALPPNPNLEYDRKQAKTLLKAYRAGDDAAVKQVRAFHPRLENIPDASIPPDEFKLSDAQLVIAREYGFSSWPRLKHEIETRLAGLDDQFRQFIHAVKHEDTARVRDLLKVIPALKSHINDPVIDFDSPALAIAAGRNNRALVDTLLEHGADVNVHSAWWAGAFGPLHNAAPDMARYLIERGAKVDVHAAAELGMMDVLRALVEADPSLVNAKGPDGQRPLHFARSTETMDYLLEHGADINARDVDHRGTAAQWLVCSHPHLTRHLLERGAQADLFMAAALGESALVTTLLDADPDAINKRIGQPDYPLVPPAPGRHIYVYNFGDNKSPHAVARKYGHEDAYQLLLERSSPPRRFVAACERADVETARRLLSEFPTLVESLSYQDKLLLNDAAWENNLAAVRFMLEAGFDPQVRAGDDMTPLHSSAFHGFVEVVNLLLQHNPLLEQRNQYGGTPLSTAIYGSVHSWRRDGDFPATVEALLKAGAVIAPEMYPSGNEAVDAVLRRYLDTTKD